MVGEYHQRGLGSGEGPTPSAASLTRVRVGVRDLGPGSDINSIKLKGRV